MDVQDIYQRTELLLGKENVEKIKKLNVCICGVGGVGSYAMEALARLGVLKITIIDKDVVDVTNINRQLIATIDNIGNLKIEEAEKRINSINPEIKVIAVKDYIDKDNVDKYIINDYDYVIDAIDSIESKVSIIKRCKELNIKIISSMGMANRVDPLKIKVADISKTEMCPLAKIIRKRLRELEIKDVKVIFSTEPAVKNNTGILGSVSFVPSVAGLVISSEIVKDIIGKNYESVNN